MSYIYQHVSVVRVIDGDTVELVVDMGNHMRWTQVFRLRRIDAPDRSQIGYREAGAYLMDMLRIPLSRIETFKPDKYGRWLVDLYVAPEQGGELHVNTLMVLNGHATPYDGGKKS